MFGRMPAAVGIRVNCTQRALTTRCLCMLTSTARGRVESGRGCSLAYSEDRSLGPYQSQQLPQSAFFSSAARPSKKTKKQRHSTAGKHKEEVPSSPASSSVDNAEMVRLSKRMSELDICSRREADRYIMEGRVMIGNQPVEPLLGQKVPAQETDIVLLSQGVSNNTKRVQRRALQFSWPDLRATTVILHKPLGCVSGQPEDAPQGGEQKKHVPAVRLLTPSNAHIVKSNYGNTEKTQHSSDNLQQEEYKEAKQIVKQELHFDLHHHDAPEATLQGYVPAGRLDLNSSGILLFTSDGIMAKKLISPEGLLEKEYVVLLEPVQSLTRYERQAGMTHLPVTAREHNTARMLKGGYTLWGDHRPLRPVADVEWLDLKRSDSLAQLYFPLAAKSHRNLRVLRIILKEGRKHQVRRMCRELLGMHVVDLVRTRIGPIHLESLPEGKWRPLRRHEAETIYSSS